MDVPARTEEVRAHCERCYGDKAETPEVQAEMIQRQRIKGDRRVALQKGRVTITVDKVLRACFSASYLLSVSVSSHIFLSFSLFLLRN